MPQQSKSPVQCTGLLFIFPDILIPFLNQAGNLQKR